MQGLLRYRPYIISSLVWIIILGLYVVYDRWPRPEPIVIETPAPEQSQIVVHIAGAVAAPGVYRLAPDARIEQAVAAAGGLLPDASRMVNLAARVADGQMVYIPLAGETPPPAVSLPQQSTAGGEDSANPGRLDINQATADQIEALPGIGPTLAQRIVAYREAHGSFKTIEELDLVQGIGPACLAEIRDLVIVQ